MKDSWTDEGHFKVIAQCVVLWKCGRFGMPVSSIFLERFPRCTARIAPFTTYYTYFCLS